MRKKFSHVLIVALMFSIYGCGGSGGDSSPTSASSSATALCNDGTYSYSQNCSGTCSHHDGVKTWYVEGCGT